MLRFMNLGARGFLALALVVTLAGCDDKPSSGTPGATPSAKPQPSAKSEPAPAVETKPALSLVLDDKRFTANSDKVDLAASDPKNAIAGAIAGKSGVEGAIVDLIVMRETLTPKVALVLAALRAAKAQGVNVKTLRRDGSTTGITFTWGIARPECAAVGMIGKDNAITAWTVGGGTAAKFARGFAGPDLTLGSAGVRKAVQACEATVVYLSAADNITWGLTFDLALAIRGGEDGGAPTRAANITLLPEAPVPGRKVATD